MVIPNSIGVQVVENGYIITVTGYNDVVERVTTRSYIFTYADQAVNFVRTELMKKPDEDSNL
jgi:hypothetical protein